MEYEDYGRDDNIFWFRGCQVWWIVIVLQWHRQRSCPSAQLNNRTTKQVCINLHATNMKDAILDSSIFVLKSHHWIFKSSGPLRSSKAQAVKMEPVKTEPPPVKADGNDVIGYRDVMRDVEWMYDVAMGLMYVCIYIYIPDIYVGVPGLFEFAFTFAGKGQDVLPWPPGRGGGWHRGRRRSTDGFQP